MKMKYLIILILVILSCNCALHDFECSFSQKNEDKNCRSVSALCSFELYFVKTPGALKLREELLTNPKIQEQELCNQISIMLRVNLVEIKFGNCNLQQVLAPYDKSIGKRILNALNTEPAPIPLNQETVSEMNDEEKRLYQQFLRFGSKIQKISVELTKLKDADSGMILKVVRNVMYFGKSICNSMYRCYYVPCTFDFSYGNKDVGHSIYSILYKNYDNEKFSDIIGKDQQNLHLSIIFNEKLKKIQTLFPDKYFFLLNSEKEKKIKFERAKSFWDNNNAEIDIITEFKDKFQDPKFMIKLKDNYNSILKPHIKEENEKLLKEKNDLNKKFDERNKELIKQLMLKNKNSMKQKQNESNEKKNEKIERKPNFLKEKGTIKKNPSPIKKVKKFLGNGSEKSIFPKVNIRNHYRTKSEMKAIINRLYKGEKPEKIIKKPGGLENENISKMKENLVLPLINH